MALSYRVSLWWQAHLDWFPIQPCLVCGRLFWGGFPTGGWMPAFKTYCSAKCHDQAEVV